MAVDLIEPYLARASGLAVTTVQVPVVVGSATALVVQVSIRRGGTAALGADLAGVAGTWTRVDMNDDTQLVLRSRTFVGTGPLSDGTLTMTSDTSLDAVALVVWGVTGTAVVPTDVVGSANAGAVDSSTPSVTITPSVAGTLVLGHGSSRSSDLTTAGTGFATRMSGWQVGTAGVNVLSWTLERTTSPAVGEAAPVGGTLAAAREWIIVGHALAPSGGASVVTGAGAATVTVVSAGAGVPVQTGAGAATARVTAAGSGAAPTNIPQGTGAATARVTAAGAGTPVPRGTGTATARATGVGAGAAVPNGAGAATVRVTATGTGTGQAIPKGTGAAVLTLTGVAVGLPVYAGAGAATVYVTATGTGVAAGLPAPPVPPGAVSALPQRRPESALLRTIRGPHNVLASAQWSNDGATWHDATVTSGSVTADRTAQVRWTANANLAGVSIGRAGINPVSTRVRLHRGVVVPRQGVWWSPWGVYAVTDVTRTRMGLDVELKGLEQVLQSAGFLAPRQVGGDTARNVVASLVHEVLPDVGISWRAGTDPDQWIPTIIEDSDRWKVLAGGADDTSVAGALGAEIFFDSGGTLVVAPVPTLADPPVWTVDTGAGGVQVDVSESLSADGVFNVVASVGERADGSAPVGPGSAWDDNPTSLTYAGPDPVRDPLAPGRLGLQVRLLTRTYASPLLTTLGQCQKSSASILANSLGLSASMGFTAVANPSLAPGNVVDVEDMDGRLAPHLLDSWTADLTGISMACRTRTTTRRL